MERITRNLVSFSKSLDLLAGIILLGIMAFVCCNVLMRIFLGAPISGVVEFVGFFTSIVIGLALANCGATGGHVAVEYFYEKFPLKVQYVLKIVLGFISAAFLFFAAYQVGVYAVSILQSGQKSATTLTPFWPFVLIVGFGVLVLGLVVLAQTVLAVKGGKGK